MKNKKIAIWYSTAYGRNDGCPLYWFNVLKRQLNMKVLHLSPVGDQKEITRRFGKFDLHIWVDWGEDGLSWKEWELPKDGGKTVYVCSDAHLGYKYRVNKAKKFDYVYVNQFDMVEKFAKDGVKAKWLPHAAEPLAYKKFDVIKKYDVCFIGHLQDVKNYNGFSRVDALDRLFKEFPNFYFGSRNPAFPEINLFEDAAKKFCKSRIVFNISIKDDINMRVFETLSTGSFLLTNYIPTLDKLFGTNHLGAYNSLNDMVKKAKYYLENEEEREKIAAEGHKEFMAKHTYKHRVERVLKECLK